MTHFAKKYLLYLSLAAWVNTPSNAFSAVCSFPLTQTAVQSCENLDTSGGTGSINNAGTISGTQNAILNQGGTITTLLNTGLIAGDNINGTGIYSAFKDFVFRPAEITNFINDTTGIISGQNGVIISGLGPGNNSHIGTTINNGSIQGNYTGFYLTGSATADTITNNAGALITGSFLGLGVLNNSHLSTLNNSGVISGTGSTGLGLHLQGGSVDTIINTAGATIHGESYAIYFFRDYGQGGFINTINNNGTISSSNTAIFNGWDNIYFPAYANIDTINNGGLIQGSSTAINNASVGTINNLNNSGVISGLNNVALNNLGVIHSIDNDGLITGGIHGIKNSGTIDAISNTSTIFGGNHGILNSGEIDQINNTGTISGNNYGIYNAGKIITGISNAGTISSLANKQGSWNGGRLSYTGAVPGSYFIIISSANNYGQIAFSNPTGTMNFNIASGSSVQKGTYTNIMTGISSSNISNKSGVFDGLSWKLTQNDTGAWDLIFGYMGVSIKNTTTSFYSNQQSINSFLHQRYAVMAVVLNYDCSTFDKYGVCISFQSRATGFGNQSTGAGVLTASHKITEKIHAGVFLDYQVNQDLPGGLSFSPGGVQSGYNNATFGGFAGYYANPDRTGLQAKISGAYNPGKVTVTRPLLENTEAGMGAAGLNASGVYGELGWGIGLAGNITIMPFVGMREIDVTRNAYNESYNVAVQYPVSYASYYERVITSIVGSQIRTAITDRLSFQAGVWAELDIRRSANSYSGWTTISGLETFALAHGGAQNRLRPAGYAGTSYEINRRQRITANIVLREQAFSDRTNVTGLVGYQISF